MKTVYEGRKFRVRSNASVDVVVHPGSVVILPFVEGGLHPRQDSKIAILQHERPAIGKKIWELPAGTSDVTGETPANTAIRELEEETGYHANLMTYLCSFYPSPGFLNEIIYAYVATRLFKTKQNLGAEEKLTVEIMDFAKAVDMVRKGEIVDAKTMIMLLQWEDKLRRLS